MDLKITQSKQKKTENVQELGLSEGQPAVQDQHRTHEQLSQNIVTKLSQKTVVDHPGSDTQ